MNDFRDNTEVINNLRHDNGTYFEMVYKYYFPFLYSYATQYIEKEEAKEVVQETMLWLWENKSTLMADMSLKSLLFTIVKNKSINRIHHDHIKNRIHASIYEKQEKMFDDPDFYLENELFALFHEALDKLPEDLRTVFELSRMDGLTHKEIAEKLQVSCQTVNYRLGKALQLLRVELKDYLPILLILLM
ncbi:MAG TPA: RNA polymerase sigma-70 factor [Porphyromonadaceae bacterium]|jgi:RNA polymerase sigma-70 factor (ECF subfamily)|nr:RNA polymerase sigma-70 factor [Porphyromonadaceae bacterium]